MSHEHTENILDKDAKKPIVPFRSALVFTVFMIALFVAAVNFVKIMSHDTGGHGDAGHGHDATATHGSHDGATHDNHDTTPAATHDNHDAAATDADNGHNDHADDHSTGH